MTNHTPGLGDVDAVSGGLDRGTTVGTTLPPVTDINFNPKPYQGPNRSFMVEAFDPWGDVIAEDAAQASVNTPPRARPLRTDEQNEVLGIFMDLLAGPTGDGAAKRARGEKPSWKIDPSHPAKALKHLGYEERYDAESGCHKNVHAAWRLLAEAYQDMVADGLIPVSPK